MLNKENEFYCICQKKYSGEFMVCCDICYEWFHPKCLQVKKKKIKQMDFFFCNFCKNSIDNQLLPEETEEILIQNNNNNNNINDNNDIVNNLKNYNFYKLPLLKKNCNIIFIPNVISELESNFYYKYLLEKVCWKQEIIPIFGKDYFEPRLSSFYADNNQCIYSYHHVIRTIYSWTPELLEYLIFIFLLKNSSIKKKIENICGYSFNCALLNYYRNGEDYMGIHSDDQKSLGKKPVIASLSFGCERLFYIQSKDKEENYKINLTNGSLLLMSGNTQIYYLHSLPKMNSAQTSRINITFRKVFPTTKKIINKKRKEILPSIIKGIKSSKLGIGHPLNIPEGTCFQNRLDLWISGIHRRQIGGIAGNSYGVESILISGNYLEDEDQGILIKFSGSGGKNCQGIQVEDQKFTRGNLALKKSMDLQLDVRVIRSYKLNSKYAPEKGFRYDGIYIVTKFEIVIDPIFGCKIIIFELKKKNGIYPPIRSLSNC